MLQDALNAKEAGRPFVVTFCGVNGVGKSTNLAKVNMVVLLLFWPLVASTIVVWPLVASTIVSTIPGTIIYCCF